MASVPATSDTWAEEQDRPVLPRRPVKDTAEMDITPMIDITFLLLIFFLVCSTMDQQIAVDLPPARHGTGVSERTAVIITIAETEGGGSARVYLADGKVGPPLPEDKSAQAAEIYRAVADGYASGKPAVLVKAEKGVQHGDVSDVAAAAAQVEGIQLHLAVFEIQ